MRLDQIAAILISRLVGQLARRAAIAAAMALFAMIAVYQFTVAGTVALEMRFGPLHAHLIIAGIYVVLALIAFGALWAMRARPAKAKPAKLPRSAKLAKAEASTLAPPLEAHIVGLVEAAMMGYAMARKGGRARE